MKITFHGAAQEVTGSCFMVETESPHFLVDGAKQVRIFGEEIPVHASVYTVGGGLSAHADLPALLA